MKYNRMLAFCAGVVLTLAASCDKYDDSKIWDEVDKAYNELTAIKPKVEALSQQAELVASVISNGAITNIVEAQDGGYTISYKDADNVVKTVTIAAKDDTFKGDIFGTTTCTPMRHRLPSGLVPMVCTLPPRDRKACSMP